MQNIFPDLSFGSPSAHPSEKVTSSFPSDQKSLEGPCTRSQTTVALTRGVARLFSDMGLAVLPEFHLPNGRRADLAGLNAKGRLVLAEVKSCKADFNGDTKWRSYLDYCDAFYFTVAQEFPRDILPDDEGLILADGFGAAIVRHARERKLVGPRRKALTLKFARQAALRASFLTT